MTIEERADQAKRDQLAEMRRANEAGDSLAAYWAGSASASVMHHCKRGAVVTLRSGEGRGGGDAGPPAQRPSPARG